MNKTITKITDVEALAISKFINELNEEDEPIITLETEWASPFGMLFLALTIRHFNEKHPSKHIFKYKKNCIATDYMGHMGFFKTASEKCNFGKNPGEAIGNKNYIPITKIDISEIHRMNIQNGQPFEIGNSIERESCRLAQILSRNEPEIDKLLKYLITELLRNIPEHSNSNTAWVCGQYWPGELSVVDGEVWSNSKAEIAIIDEGIGIKESLRQNNIYKEYINNDEDALNYAIKAGISQAFTTKNKRNYDDVWENSGFGLYMVSEICKELNGSFCLVSGNKYIYIDKGIKTGNTLFKGTAVKISISTNKNFSFSYLVNKISNQGEEQAKAMKNAFKQASKSSKGIT